MKPVERFDPAGGKAPKGEWRLGEQPTKPAWLAATGQKRRSSPYRGKPVRVVELKGRTGSETGW